MLPQQPLTTNGCCHCSSRSAPRSIRGWNILTGGLSLGVWIVMPKCPACLAAYVACWTGLGLSFTQAAYVRWSLMLLSIIAFCYLLIYSMASRKNRALTKGNEA